MDRKNKKSGDKKGDKREKETNPRKSDKEKSEEASWKPDSTKRPLRFFRDDPKLPTSDCDYVPVPGAIPRPRLSRGNGRRTSSHDRPLTIGTGISTSPIVAASPTRVGHSTHFSQEVVPVPQASRRPRHRQGDDDSEPDGAFGVEAWCKSELKYYRELIGIVADFIQRKLSEPPSEHTERALEELDRSPLIKSGVEVYVPNLEEHMRQLGIGGRIPPGMTRRELFERGRKFQAERGCAVETGAAGAAGAADDIAGSRQQQLEALTPTWYLNSLDCVERSEKRDRAYAEEAIATKALRRRVNQIAAEVDPREAARRRALKSQKAKVNQRFTEPQDEPDVPEVILHHQRAISNQLYHFWYHNAISMHNIKVFRQLKLYRLHPDDVDESQINMGMKAMNEGMRIIFEEHKRRLSLRPKRCLKLDKGEPNIVVQPGKRAQAWEVANVLPTAIAIPAVSTSERRESASPAAVATAFSQNVPFREGTSPVLGQPQKSERDLGAVGPVPYDVVVGSTGSTGRRERHPVYRSLSPPPDPVPDEVAAGSTGGRERHSVSRSLSPPPNPIPDEVAAGSTGSTGRRARRSVSRSVSPPPDPDLLCTFSNLHDMYLDATPLMNLPRVRDLPFSQHFSNNKLREYNCLMNRWVEILQMGSRTRMYGGRLSITATPHESYLRELWNALQTPNHSDRAHQVRRLFFENPFLRYSFVLRFDQLKELKRRQAARKKTSM